MVFSLSINPVGSLALMIAIISSRVLRIRSSLSINSLLQASLRRGVKELNVMSEIYSWSGDSFWGDLRTLWKFTIDRLSNSYKIKINKSYTFWSIRTYGRFLICYLRFINLCKSRRVTKWRHQKGLMLSYFKKVQTHTQEM